MKKTILFLAAAAIMAASCEKTPEKATITNSMEAVAALTTQTSDIPARKQKCEMDKYALDLGLSVYWATINVEATQVGKLGGYYKWGESVNKDDSAQNRYRWYDSGKPSGYSDEFEALTKLEGDNDPVVKLIGNGWRLPTVAEFKELEAMCKYEHMQLDGVYGGLLWCANGALFFPGEKGFMDRQAYYWTSEKAEDGIKAMEMAFTVASAITYESDAHQAMQLRAVKSK